ncbi:MAG: hypothetical protein ACWGOX_13250 [Desulforhopalus sp.]
MRLTESFSWTLKTIVVCGVLFTPILTHAMGGGSSHIGASAHHWTTQDTDNMPMFNSQGSASSMQSKENHMRNSGTMTGGELMQNPGKHGFSQDRNGSHSSGGMSDREGSGSGGSGDHGGGGGMR